MGDLETLKAITSFSFLSNNIQYWVNQLSTFSVVTFSPIVTSSCLTKDKVIGSEKLTEGTSSYRVHGSWFEIHQDSSWYITSTGGFIVIDVDSFELQIRISMIGTCWVNTVLIWDDFPKFGTDLVTTLSCLNMNDFSHFSKLFTFFEKKIIFIYLDFFYWLYSYINKLSNSNFI